MEKSEIVKLEKKSKTQFFAAYKKCTLNIKTEKIYHANTNHSKARVAELMSDKVDFKAKNVTKVKGGHFIMISGQLMHRI